MDYQGHLKVYDYSEFTLYISIGLKQWFPSNSKDDVRNPVYRVKDIIHNMYMYNK